jgi:hypothetical protein
MCIGNHITSLPSLPATIEYLDCSKNNLRTLPSLPDGLIVLGCEENPLEMFPDLPPHLSSISYTLLDEVIRLTNMDLQTIQRIQKEIQEWMEMMAQHSKDRCMTRCAKYKEEIMIKVWCPSRVEKLLEMGYDIEDM